MDISIEKYESDSNRSNPLLTLWLTAKTLLRRLLGAFTLTEEERSEAGIYLGGEGRE